MFRVFVYLFIFSVSTVSGDDSVQSQVRNELTSLFPFAHGIKKVELEEVCTMQGGRARRGSTRRRCEIVPKLVDDPERLKTLVRMYRPTGNEQDDYFYIKAREFLNTYDNFERCEGASEESLMFDRLLGNYECAGLSQAAPSSEFSDFENINNLVNNPQSRAYSIMQRNILNRSLEDSLKSYMAFIHREQSDGERISLSANRKRAIVRMLCTKVESGGFLREDTTTNRCDDQMRAALSEIINSEDKNPIPSRSQLQEQYNQILSELNSIIIEGNARIESLTADTPTDSVGRRRLPRQIGQLKRQTSKAYEAALEQFKSSPGNELLLTEVISEHFNLPDGDRNGFSYLEPLEEHDIQKGLFEATQTTRTQIDTLLNMQSNFNQDVRLRQNDGVFESDFKEKRLEDLKFLFKTNPLATAEALNKNPAMVNRFCDVIQGVIADQNWNDLKDSAFLVVGVGVATVGVLSGVGSAPSAALLTGILAASATLTAVEANHHLNRASTLSLQRELQLANILAQRTDDYSLEEMNQTLGDYRNSRNSAAFVAGFGALDIVGVGQIARVARAGRTLDSANSLARSTRGLRGVFDHPSYNDIYQEVLEKNGEEVTRAFLNELRRVDRPDEVFNGLLALKDSNKGLDLSNMVRTEVVDNPDLYRFLQNVNREALSNQYPGFSAQLRRMGSSTQYAEGQRFNSPLDIDFTRSDQFRPPALKADGSLGHDELIARLNQQDPEIRTAYLEAMNELNDNQVIGRYMQDLYTEAFQWQIKNNPTGRFADSIAEGTIDQRAINVTLIQRLKARRDNLFTHITDGGLKTGRLPAPPEEASRNTIFRQAVGTGPFIDGAFGPGLSGHGRFSHVLQRDLISDGLRQRLGDRYDEFYEFLGSKRGITFWADMFDAGGSKTFNSPEDVTSAMREFLTERPRDKKPLGI